MDEMPRDNPRGAAESRQPAAQAGSFEFNRPTIISLLMLAAFVNGITGLIGVVLAYIWRGEAHEEWESSHYQYLIATFWIGLVGGIIGFLLLFVLIGMLVLPAVAVLVVIRCVLSLLAAQKREPLANPSSWLT